MLIPRIGAKTERTIKTNPIGIPEPGLNGLMRNCEPNIIEPDCGGI